MPKVYDQPINKLKRTVFDAAQKTEELAVRHQDAKLLHAAFVSFVKAEKANAEKLQELVKTANEIKKREKAVKADLDAIYEKLASATDRATDQYEIEHFEHETEKIEGAFGDVSDEARVVPAIYERASALSRNRESLDECMSRLYSLAHENLDVTYDDFTYERILQACTTYQTAPVTINDDALDLSARLAAITVDLETLDKPIADPTFPTFTDLCVP